MLNYADLVIANAKRDIQGAERAAESRQIAAEVHKSRNLKEYVPTLSIPELVSMLSNATPMQAMLLAKYMTPEQQEAIAHANEEDDIDQAEEAVSAWNEDESISEEELIETESVAEDLAILNEAAEDDGIDEGTEEEIFEDATDASLSKSEPDEDDISDDFESEDSEQYSDLDDEIDLFNSSEPVLDNQDDSNLDVEADEFETDDFADTESFDEDFAEQVNNDTDVDLEDTDDFEEESYEQTDTEDAFEEESYEQDTQEDAFEEESYEQDIQEENFDSDVLDDEYATDEYTDVEFETSENDTDADVDYEDDDFADVDEEPVSAPTGNPFATNNPFRSATSNTTVKQTPTVAESPKPTTELKSVQPVSKPSNHQVSKSSDESTSKPATGVVFSNRKRLASGTRAVPTFTTDASDAPLVGNITVNGRKPLMSKTAAKIPNVARATTSKMNTSSNARKIEPVCGELYEDGWSLKTYLTRNKDNMDARHIDVIRRYYSQAVITRHEDAGDIYRHGSYYTK